MENKDILISNNVELDNALEFWGDMNTYNETLKEFQDSIDEKITNLEEYKNKADWENYGILSHSTKSELKYLGFNKDAEVMLQHEMAGKQTHVEFINAHFQELINTLKKINKIINEYFNGTSDIKNLLIADDSNIMLNFLEDVIGAEYNIIKANSGKETIEKLNSMSIYALLLDLNMPDTNGFGVLDYLTEHKLIEKIPVVIITGDDTEETIKKAFTYPILDVINKPFKEDNIRRVLVSINSFYDKH